MIKSEKKKVIIILYQKIVQNNNITKFALFSTVKKNILTNKDVIQIVKSIN